jgi:hypothetical protein
MTVDRTIVEISLLCGAAAAGFVWFGWEFLQNIAATRRRAHERQNLLVQASELERRAGIDADVGAKR